jgi:hypothetical protein
MPTCLPTDMPTPHDDGSIGRRGHGRYVPPCSGHVTMACDNRRIIRLHNVHYFGIQGRPAAHRRACFHLSPRFLSPIRQASIRWLLQSQLDSWGWASWAQPWLVTCLKVGRSPMYTSGTGRCQRCGERIRVVLPAHNPTRMRTVCSARSLLRRALCKERQRRRWWRNAISRSRAWQTQQRLSRYRSAAPQQTATTPTDGCRSRQAVHCPGGVLEGITEGKCYVDMSTVDEETSQKINEAITGKGGRFLEVRVATSRPFSAHHHKHLLPIRPSHYMQPTIHAFQPHTPHIH